MNNKHTRWIVASAFIAGAAFLAWKLSEMTGGESYKELSLGQAMLDAGHAELYDD